MLSVKRLGFGVECLVFISDFRGKCEVVKPFEGVPVYGGSGAGVVSGGGGVGAGVVGKL